MTSAPQFAPMQSLGFPSQDIVGPAARAIRKELAEIKTRLRKETGFGLPVKSYEHAASSGKKQKGPTGQKSVTVENRKREEGWNIHGMSVYGHVVESQQHGNPTLQRGSPQQPLVECIQPMWPPTALSYDTQSQLIDQYYEHIHPYTPIIHRPELEKQLDTCQRDPSASYLSPLFFYALFAASSRFGGNSTEVGDYCFQQALAFYHMYFGFSSVSSVIGLLLMAQYQETLQLQSNFSLAWTLTGAAVRMIQDLGLYRRCNVGPREDDRELCVRTFWMAFIMDRVMSMISGRPFLLEEKDIDMPVPTCIEFEKNTPAAQTYVQNFCFLIDISKVVGRIIRFNYSPQSALQRGPSLHQEAMLSTLDSWVSSLIKDFAPEAKNPDNIQQRFDHVKVLALYLLLVLLHRPYVDDVSTNTSSKKSGETNPSFEICSGSAIIITHLIRRLKPEELNYLVRRPICLHAMLTATRVHLMNASFPKDPEMTMYGEINFLRNMAILQNLSLAKTPNSILSKTLNAFTDAFEQRSEKIVSDYAASQLDRLSSLSLSPKPSFFAPHTESPDTAESFASAQTSETASQRQQSNERTSNKPGIKIIQFEPKPSTSSSHGRRTSAIRHPNKPARKRTNTSSADDTDSAATRSPENETRIPQLHEYDTLSSSFNTNMMFPDTFSFDNIGANIVPVQPQTSASNPTDMFPSETLVYPVGPTYMTITNHLPSSTTTNDPLSLFTNEDFGMGIMPNATTADTPESLQSFYVFFDNGLTETRTEGMTNDHVYWSQ